MEKVFTISSVGNVSDSLYGAPYTKENYVLLTDKIIEIMKEIINENKAEFKKFNFLYGGGFGSDHVFYMAICKLREHLPDEYSDLEFTVSILYPFQNFKKRSSASIRKIVAEMAEYADEVEYLYHRPFKSLADVIERDKELCNRADAVIAVLNPFNTFAGGYRAIQLSKSKGMKIYIINPNDFKDLEVTSPKGKKGGKSYGFKALNKYWKTDPGEL